MKFRTLTIAAMAATAILSGCASQPDAFSSAPVYSSGTYQASQARLVTVEAIQPVRLQKAPNGTWQAIAAPAAGGVVGGLIGNSIGGGDQTSRQITATLGAIVGTVAGTALQSAHSVVNGYVYTISYMSTNPGEGRVTLTVPQEADNTPGLIAPGWRPGKQFIPAPARLTRGASGDRVIPL